MKTDGAVLKPVIFSTCVGIFPHFVFLQGELGLPGPAGVDGEKVWVQRSRNLHAG